MKKSYPLKFTLENGTHVVVNKTGTNTFDFTLNPHKGPTSQFTYVEDGRSKTAVEESLDFEQIDALRTFWLENEDIV
jgi:hypothetical protein